ncbi:hypothetical protein PIIN_10747, partial [Serendipita indica DSM 11827]
MNNTLTNRCHAVDSQCLYLESLTSEPDSALFRHTTSRFTAKPFDYSSTPLGGLTGPLGQHGQTGPIYECVKDGTYVFLTGRVPGRVTGSDIRLANVTWKIGSFYTFRQAYVSIISELLVGSGSALEGIGLVGVGGTGQEESETRQRSDILYRVICVGESSIEMTLDAGR